MKDQLLLLSAVIGSALIGWAIWHFLGKEGLTTFPAVVLLIVLADNIRLRHKLKNS
ncbi:MAG: hypothetical protein HY308_11920 [Gammaproteobacteria bacterium]|nr:hypothetical protein [Gammaproteobacteria bacterium]